jgi:hypothetical protein
VKKDKLGQMNINELMGSLMQLNFIFAGAIHVLRRGGEPSYDPKVVIRNLMHTMEEGSDIPHDFDEVFIGPLEDVGEKQITSGIEWGWKRFPVYINPEDKSDLQSLEDLIRQAGEIIEEITKRLLAHKTKPFIGMEKIEGLILSAAASLLDGPYILEERLSAQFNKNLDGIVKRYSNLPLFFVEEKPSKLVLNRLKEAINCYVQGLYQSCAIMCRAVFETAIREKIKNETGTVRDVTLGKLLSDARRFGVLTEEDYKTGLELKDIGDTAVHAPRRCSVEEAYKSLEITKNLLNKLHRK